MALLGGQTLVGGADGNLLTWATVAELVSDAAIEEGLAQAPIADPFTSADVNILQLLALLKSAGRSVNRERGWSHLQNEYSFATTPGQAVYALPADFREMIDQSGWNRTTAYPLGGPVGADVWQFAKAIPVAGNLMPWVRFQGGTIEISPTPASVQTIAFEYQTVFWVKPVGQPGPTSDMPKAATDVICFNSALMVCALKLAWEKAKRFDTTTAQADYDRALAAAANEDAASPAIAIGRRSGIVRAIDWDNVPLTGIGQ